MKNLENKEHLIVKELLTINEKLLLGNYLAMNNITLTTTNKKIFFKDYFIGYFTGRITKENIAYIINDVSSNIKLKPVKSFNVINNVAILEEITYKNKHVCYYLRSYGYDINCFIGNIFSVLKIVYKLKNGIKPKIKLNNLIVKLNKMRLNNLLQKGITVEFNGIKVHQANNFSDAKYNVFIYENGKQVASASISNSAIYNIKYLTNNHIDISMFISNGE